MGKLDLISRLLSERYLESLLPSVLANRRVRVLRREATSLKEVTERISDEVIIAELDGEEHVLHVEMQSAHEKLLPWRMAAYHALLARRFHPLPVFSLVIYLMHRGPRAALPSALPSSPGRQILAFQYEIFQPWRAHLGIELVRRNPSLAPLACLSPGDRGSRSARAV